MLELLESVESVLFGWLLPFRSSKLPANNVQLPVRPRLTPTWTILCQLPQSGQLIRCLYAASEYISVYLHLILVWE